MLKLGEILSFLLVVLQFCYGNLLFVLFWLDLWDPISGKEKEITKEEERRKKKELGKRVHTGKKR